MNRPSARGLAAAPPTSRLVERHLQRFRRQLSDPLTANGYALIANSGATGALGLVYWLLMARLYPTAAVGIASAIYAAMNLLAGITAQSFNGALNQLHPAGRTANSDLHPPRLRGERRRLDRRRHPLPADGPAGGARPTRSSTGRSPGRSSSLVAAWAIFTLQDSVLVGLRSAFWVLVENGIFGVVKLLLLIALVAALPFHLGIYVSWMLPAVVAVPLINVLIFRHLVPRHTLLDPRLPARQQPPDRAVPRRGLLGCAVHARHGQSHSGRRGLQHRRAADRLLLHRLGHRRASST